MIQMRPQDVSYVYRYDRFLSPMQIVSAVLQAGKVAPRLSGPFHYLDIGCGYADSLLIHAALYPHGTFYGIDVNPTHIAAATRIAAEAQLDNVHLIEATFTEIKRGDVDLPACDILVAAGVLSGLTEAQRADFLDIFAKRLRPGGFALVSYNAAPQQLSMKGVVRFLHEIYQAASGTNEQRVAKAMEGWKVAIDNKIGVIGNKNAEVLYQSMKQQDPRLLAHDYLVSETWQPYFASEVHDLMHELARLEFVGLSDADSYFVESALPDEVKRVLNTAPNRSIRSELTDFLTLRDVRRDIFARGVVGLTESLFVEGTDQMEAVRMRLPKNFLREVQLSGVRVNFDQHRVDQFAQIFAEEDVIPFSQLVTRLNAALVPPSDAPQMRSDVSKVFRDTLVMSALGNVVLRLRQPDRQRVEERCARLNAALRRHRDGEMNAMFVLPQFDTAVVLNPIESLLFKARGASDQLAGAFRLANERGMRLRNNDNQELTDLDSFRKALATIAGDFYQNRLPQLLQAEGKGAN